MGRLTFFMVFLLIVLVFVSLPYFLRGAFPIKYSDLIYEFSARYDMDPMLIAAVIKAESSYRPEAVSSRGALGLMQLMPETAAWLVEQKGGQTPDLLDPKVNIELGTYYLKYLLERFPTEYAALAAYNAGPTNARRWLEANVWDGTYERTGQIPYAETRSYVRKVTMMRSLYQLLYQRSMR